MVKINMTQVIHIAADVVIIAGLSIFFHKKHSQSERRIEMLEKNIDDMAMALENQENMINQLYKIIQENRANFAPMHEKHVSFAPIHEKHVSFAPMHEKPRIIEEATIVEENIAEELAEELAEVRKNNDHDVKNDECDVKNDKCENNKCSLLENMENL